MSSMLEQAIIDATAFTGGTDGAYASWNGSSFTDYDDTERKLLRQSYFASNTLDLLDISDINCSTTDDLDKDA